MQSVYHVRSPASMYSSSKARVAREMQSVYHVRASKFAFGNFSRKDAIDAIRVPRARLVDSKCFQSVYHVYEVCIYRVAQKVAHTVHGFPALQESLRLLSDLMLLKHETILNTAALYFSVEKEKAPCLTLSRAVSHPSIFR